MEQNAALHPTAVYCRRALSTGTAADH